MAVAPAGTYASNVQLSPDRQPCQYLITRFLGLDALPTWFPTVSKHRRQGKPEYRHHNNNKLSKFILYLTDDADKGKILTKDHIAPGMLPNCPFSWGNLGSHLIHGSLGPSESISWTKPPLVQAIFRVKPTHIHTDRQCHTCENSLYLCTLCIRCNVKIAQKNENNMLTSFFSCPIGKRAPPSLVHSIVAGGRAVALHTRSTVSPASTDVSELVRCRSRNGRSTKQRLCFKQLQFSHRHQLTRSVADVSPPINYLGYIHIENPPTV